VAGYTGGLANMLALPVDVFPKNAVASVWGLASMGAGFGGMVSCDIDGTVEETTRFVSSLRYFALGESLGGVRALICLPSKMTHASIPPETRRALGLSDTLVRLSPGCESARDLVHDLVEGLDRLGPPVADTVAEAEPIVEHTR